MPSGPVPGGMGTGTLLFARFLGCRCFLTVQSRPMNRGTSACFFPDLNFTGLACATPRLFIKIANPCLG